MFKYKLRAECLEDVQSLLKLLNNRIEKFSMSKDHPDLPDVEFEFTTMLTYDELFEIIKEIEDSHVMYQTLQTFKYYTGERNYDLE